MKTLNTIQTLSKIGKVLSKIIYICCIIGAIGCVVGLVSLPFADTGILKIGGVSIHGLIVNEVGIDLIALYPAMVEVMILCIGQAVLANFAEAYLKNELTVRTQFTLAGAKEMLRFGILTLAIPTGCAVISSIVEEITAGFMKVEKAALTDLRFDNESSIALGVMFIVMSLLCRYGAELMGKEKSK